MQALGIVSRAYAAILNRVIDIVDTGKSGSTHLDIGTLHDECVDPATIGPSLSSSSASPGTLTCASSDTTVDDAVDDAFAPSDRFTFTPQTVGNEYVWIVT